MKWKYNSRLIYRKNIPYNKKIEYLNGHTCFLNVSTIYLKCFSFFFFSFGKNLKKYERVKENILILKNSGPKQHI